MGKKEVSNETQVVGGNFNPTNENEIQINMPEEGSVKIKVVSVRKLKDTPVVVAAAWDHECEGVKSKKLVVRRRDGKGKLLTSKNTPIKDKEGMDK